MPYRVSTQCAFLLLYLTQSGFAVDSNESLGVSSQANNFYEQCADFLMHSQFDKENTLHVAAHLTILQISDLSTTSQLRIRIIIIFIIILTLFRIQKTNAEYDFKNGLFVARVCFYRLNINKHIYLLLFMC